MLFHKVRDVAALPDMRLNVQFANGVTKVYNTKSPGRRLPAFRALRNGALFGSVEVGQGGYGIVWDDDLDLSCNEL